MRKQGSNCFDRILKKNRWKNFHLQKRARERPPGICIFEFGPAGEERPPLGGGAASPHRRARGGVRAEHTRTNFLSPPPHQECAGASKKRRGREFAREKTAAKKQTQNARLIMNLVRRWPLGSPSNFVSPSLVHPPSGQAPAWEPARANIDIIKHTLRARAGRGDGAPSNCARPTGRDSRRRIKRSSNGYWHDCGTCVRVDRAIRKDVVSNYYRSGNSKFKLKCKKRKKWKTTPQNGSCRMSGAAAASRRRRPRLRPEAKGGGGSREGREGGEEMNEPGYGAAIDPANVTRISLVMARADIVGSRCDRRGCRDRGRCARLARARRSPGLMRSRAMRSAGQGATLSGADAIAGDALARVSGKAPPLTANVPLAWGRCRICDPACLAGRKYLMAAQRQERRTLASQNCAWGVIRLARKNAETAHRSEAHIMVSSDGLEASHGRTPARLLRWLCFMLPCFGM